MKESICFYVACALVPLMFTSECPSLCQCSNGLMQCTGLLEFVNHTEIPENVTSVVYEFCSFKEISSPLRYRNISELKIRSSGVENISDAVFDEMDALETLDLHNNTLRSLSPSCFSSLSSLRNLSLSQNHLTTLPERIFSGFPSLMRVDLDDNKHFNFTPEMFLNTSDSLVAISCQRCDIRELMPVAEALSSLVHLKELSLSGNNLGNLVPFAFSKLPQLEILCLDNCLIKSANGSSFTKLEKLHKLNLSHNLIENLPSDTFVDSKTTLQIISLNDNHLNSLDKELLQWSRVEQLHLDNNRWICDCDLQWIHDYNKFDGFSPNAICAEPELMRGSSLFSYTVDCETGSSSFFIIFIVIILVIVIICVALVSCFVFRFFKRAVKRKNHERGKRFSRYSAVYKDTVEPAAHLKPKSATELLS